MTSNRFISEYNYICKQLIEIKVDREFHVHEKKRLLSPVPVLWGSKLQALSFRKTPEVLYNNPHSARVINIKQLGNEMPNNK